MFCAMRGMANFMLELASQHGTGLTNRFHHVAPLAHGNHFLEDTMFLSSKGGGRFRVDNA